MRLWENCYGGQFVGDVDIVNTAPNRRYYRQERRPDCESGTGTLLYVASPYECPRKRGESSGGWGRRPPSRPLE
jgi:hypothetical protein